MLIVMRSDATPEQIKVVEEKVKSFGLGVHQSKGAERTVIGAIGKKVGIEKGILETLPGVSEIIPISKPYKVVSREFQQDDSVIIVAGNIKIGGKNPIITMAGPCSVESREQILEIAHEVKKAGAKMLRGGAFKPRTSPYAFQGLGEEGLKYLAEARKETGLAVVTEVMDTRDVELVAKYADMLQIGARNMQNFNLLKEVGKTNKPVFLKRGPSATIEEWLMAAEYVCSEGNKQVVLCERGIRTIENYTRNTLDISAVPVIKKLSHLPIVIDPSHGVGRWDLVPAMARAAVAAGAHGLMVEVHNEPDKATSDGGQSLKYEKFSKMMKEIKIIEKAMRDNEII
ncbi:MAG: 3-deoxy-7-phosphoheptulonate synthase [Candidatus Margulisbacteria bacterium]|nr:3-deoxy-7-phosphoheptulonate synthase [Candidatus Margulisiibacteriota bacterium]